MIRFTTLGAIRIAETDGAALAFPGQQSKRLALLAFLAVARPRTAHRRDSLLALLWPELDQDRARAALRQALHGIRRVMGCDAIQSGGTEDIELNPALVQCDIWDLEQAAHAGDHTRVLQLYEGELLQGLFVTGAPAFEQWLDGERARLKNLVRQSAWSESETRLRQGDGEALVRCVRVALSLSDFDEGAIRRAMQLLASAGERAAALAVYERFVSDMRREFDAAPSPATLDLAQTLRTQPSVAVAANVKLQALVTEVLETEVSIPGRQNPEASTPPKRSFRAALVTRGIGLRGRVAAAIGCVLVLSGAARLAMPANVTLDVRRVRVAQFTNQSAVASMDTVARMVAIATREALMRLDNVQVVSSTPGDDPLEMFESGVLRQDDDHAGTLVRGVLEVVNDSIELHAEVIDRNTGAIRRVVVTRTPRTTALAGASTGIQQFSDRVSAAVATALYPGWGNALSQPPSYNGYRLFLEGMQNIKREQHDAAKDAFLRAFHEDSAFTTAGLLAASEYYQMRRFAAAESIAVAIGLHRALLPAVDAHLLDWLVRSLKGDRIGARSAMTAITALTPQADLAWLQLAIDNVETARPREALAALDHIQPDAEFGEGWASYWATRIEALHLMGEHERELAVARDGLHRHPDLSVLKSYELRALAALGRVKEVQAVALTLTEAQAIEGMNAPMAMRQASLEFRAHGFPDAANAMMTRAHAWYLSRPASERLTGNYQAGLARTLYLLDDRQGAGAMFDSLLRAYPECLDCMGVLGVLAARDGKYAAAEGFSEQLATIRKPFLFGRNVLWQARIAAARGDSARATAFMNAAFAAGSEFDIMTHADPDLWRLRPESVYRKFARADD